MTTKKVQYRIDPNLSTDFQIVFKTSEDARKVKNFLQTATDFIKNLEFSEEIENEQKEEEKNISLTSVITQSLLSMVVSTDIGKDTFKKIIDAANETINSDKTVASEEFILNKNRENDKKVENKEEKLEENADKTSIESPLMSFINKSLCSLKKYNDATAEELKQIFKMSDEENNSDSKDLDELNCMEEIKEKDEIKEKESEKNKTEDAIASSSTQNKKEKNPIVILIVKSLFNYIIDNSIPKNSDKIIKKEDILKAFNNGKIIMKTTAKYATDDINLANEIILKFDQIFSNILQEYEGDELTVEQSGEISLKLLDSWDKF